MRLLKSFPLLTLGLLALPACKGSYDPRNISVMESVPPKTRVLATLPDGRDISGYPPGPSYINPKAPVTPLQAVGRYDETQNVPGDTKQIPLATKASQRGFVTSPWPPYSLIDVRGIQPGSVVLDPISKQLFRIPKNYIYIPSSYLVPKTY